MEILKFYYLTTAIEVVERLAQLSILAEAGRRASDQSVHIQRDECREFSELPGEAEATGGWSLHLQVT